jgi:hypothetical protein
VTLARFRGVVAGALVALGGVSASAAPISLWLAPTFGFDAGSVTTAQSAAIPMLPDSMFFANPVEGMAHIDLSTPNSISGVKVSNPSRSNPNRGSSVWTVTAVDADYEDLWIVIQGKGETAHELAEFYDTPNVGLEIDPSDPRWALVHPADATQYTYLAYFVGDLPQGAQHEIPIEYRVAQKLFKDPNDSSRFIFPQYRVNFLALAVPEPAFSALLGVVALALAAPRRRPAG